ncbi:ATP-binding cassette domain-containing protein, partial [Streptomyces gramineus]
MIEAQRLTKRYGEKTAVDGLDFDVRPGSVTGFLGPNGAGKSTT